MWRLRRRLRVIVRQALNGLCATIMEMDAGVGSEKLDVVR